MEAVAAGRRVLGAQYQQLVGGGFAPGVSVASFSDTSDAPSVVERLQTVTFKRHRRWFCAFMFTEYKYGSTSEDENTRKHTQQCLGSA